MADAFTDSSSLTQVTTAYERKTYFALRPELYFDRVASIRPTRQTHPGSSVLFNIMNDMAPAVTPISETADVTAVAITDNEVTVSLNEYGNAAITSARVRGLSYLPVSSDVANVVGFNAGISFDCLARNPLLAGTNVSFGQAAAGPRNTLTTANSLLRANDVRRAVVRLSSDNVRRINGWYRGWSAPEPMLDLREETGAAAWRDPHVHSRPNEIWNGEVGEFEGVVWMTTPRLTANNLEAAQGGAGGFLNGGAAGGASGNYDVFPVVIVGDQALAKTWSSAVSGPLPETVLGAVVDKLRRFVPVGWYWLGGFGRFREQAIQRIEVTASIVK